MVKNIYLISAFLGEERLYKIGITKRKVEKRIKELQTGNPAEFNIENVYVADNYAVNIEKNLHRYFREKKINGEWFYLDQDDIDQFTELCEMYYETFDLVQNNNTYIEERGITIK